jgi:hypothetical protein
MALIDEMGSPKKSDTDHIVRISWEEYERTKEKCQNKTETQCIEIKILVRLQYKPGETGYSRVTPKKKNALERKI